MKRACGQRPIRRRHRVGVDLAERQPLDNVHLEQNYACRPTAPRQRLIVGYLLRPHSAQHCAVCFALRLAHQLIGVAIILADCTCSIPGPRMPSRAMSLGLNA